VIGAAGFFSLIALLFTISVSKVPFKSILWLQTVGYTGLAVSISMTIYWVLNTTRTSPALRALELPWVTAVGRTSYSLYIWHLPLYPIIVAISKNVFESAQGQFLFSASLAIFVTGTLGVLSYRIIESKFMYSRPNTNNIRDIKPAEI
jgi:peptidoglycan/LPS O-acetylase OafA/YrhL